MHSVTCSAPVNIALVKYWGKRNEDLVLPINSSLSVSLCQDQLKAKTTVSTCKKFTKDRLWLNGREESTENPRVQNVLREVRRRTRKRKMTETDETDCEMPLSSWCVHICSENNFPTAAGLASSAAGYACLAYSLSKLFQVEGDISEIARLGSGSACRSVYGGFVEWDMGKEDTGVDSVALQVAPCSHWLELRILILVVSDRKKPIGSASGMQATVNTSELVAQRTNIVPERIRVMKEAILNKDFHTFAEQTMKDSNQLHAVCLDTYPPISYMTDISRDIIRLVHSINSFYKENKVAYTFDAGPNACLYLLENEVPLMAALVQYYFPPQDNGDSFIQGLKPQPIELNQDIKDAVPLQPQPGVIKYMISTKAGEGPRLLSEDQSLLNEKGLPKNLK